MKASLPLLSLASATLAEIHVKVDQFSNPMARDLMALKPRPLAGTESTPKLALHRRQSSCDPGRFLCPNRLWCAPDGGVCCGIYGACYPGEACCGDGCMPDDGECCSDGGYCPAGNMCVLKTSQLTGLTRVVCCTDPKCTAYIEEDGATRTLSATGGAITTAPPTTTNVVTAMETYRVTLTWTYYFYFWTYIEYSFVSSSLTTSRTTFTIMATDNAAATASIDEIEATIELDVPAEQSSLSELAEETTFGPSELATPPDFPDDSSDATSTSPPSETSFIGAGGGSGDSGDGSLAPAVWADKIMIVAGMLAAFGAGALLL